MTAAENRARRSVLPGSLPENSSFATQQVFKFITEDSPNNLKAMLVAEGGSIDVINMYESRQYSCLAFAAFKNCTAIVKLLISHARRFNIPAN